MSVGWLRVFVDVGFFFFKQKTAYEMRISDWSSDVCSSDLQAAGADRAAVNQAKAGFEFLVVEIERARANIAAVEFIAVAQLDVDRARDREIGRATCRERVCQYV